MSNFENKGRFTVVTYGCQMNLHESEKLAGILSDFGYTKTDDVNEADVVVFNTCCIRENAERRAFGNIGALKKLKAKNKNFIIAVGGCMTQQPDFAQKLKKKFPFIDVIFGTHNLEDFGEMLKKRLQSKKFVIEVLEKEGAVQEGTRRLRCSYPNAWINIMYGCDNFCSYCIVPFVRGRERCRKIEDILAECKQVIAEGYKEITLLGQNVNSYKDENGDDFSVLLSKIAKLDGEFRLCFMTNHPKDLSLSLVKAMAKYDKICNRIHLPIQSGSNKILKQMNRKYTREDYFEKVDLLRKYIPNVAITTDIMVGFPGEDEQDFLDTLDVVKRCKFAGAFSFVYSRRSGTKADKMPNQVDEKVSKRRIMELIKTQNEINANSSLEYKDKVIEILCEDFDEKKQMYMGRDQFGRMGYFACNKNMVGKMVKIKITKTGGISLIGEIVE